MKRQWYIDDIDPATGGLDEEKVASEMVGLGHTLMRLGGSAIVHPARVRDEGTVGGYRTVGIVIEYDSTAPAADLIAEEPEQPTDQPDEAPVPA